MGVYVDACIFQGWIYRGKPRKSCHLWADSLDELYRFAAKIDLPLSWFHNRGIRGKVPHFDLMASWRQTAVAAGAQELDRRETVASFKRWRIGGEACQSSTAPEKG